MGRRVVGSWLTHGSGASDGASVRRGGDTPGGIRMRLNAPCSDRPLAERWAISEHPASGPQLVHIEAGLLPAYAKLTGAGSRAVHGQMALGPSYHRTKGL